MSMKVYCTACGEDCSNGYATYYGDPHHFGCIPVKKKQPKNDEPRAGRGYYEEDAPGYDEAS